MAYDKNQYSFYNNIELIEISGRTQPAYAQLVSNSVAGESQVKLVTASATTINLLKANINRKEAIITNDSTSDMYIKFGTNATTSSYTIILKQKEIAIIDTYFGILDAVWDTETGNCLVTELE